MLAQFDNNYLHNQQQSTDLIKFQSSNQDNRYFNYQENFTKPNIFLFGLKRISKFITNFFFETSIHGFVHIVRIGNHLIERFLWWCCISIAIYGTISISMRTWTRFQTSPVVISMDRNMYFWNTTFPSLTVCPHTKIDETKLENYIKANSKKLTTEDDINEFKEFVINLANLTFENYEDLAFKKTFDIQSVDYMDLIYNLSFSFNPELSSGSSFKLYLQETITELGLCYSVNTKLAVYNSMQYWKSGDWKPVTTNETVVIHPLDGEIFIQMINLSTSYEVYFHGAMEIAEISKQRYSFSGADYTTVELQALEILTTKNARELKITQRQCRFPNENQIIYSSPIYSYNQCRKECRMQFIMNKCGCIPHFYRTRTRNGQNYPVCDVHQWKCISNIKDDVITLNSKNVKCKCETNCDDSHFFVQAFRSRFWFLGANLQWGMIDYPKMQLKRDVLFSFTDVLVYIGGTAGLFLGCSLLSLTEFLYYSTWRLARYCLNQIDV